MRTTQGYFPLDWKLVKAMAWTETGAARPQWATKPLQIGNAGDPGLQVMLRREEGSDLIVPPTMHVSFISAASNPRANIEAGVGYLLTKLANTSIRSVPEPSSQVYQVTVKAGDSLSKIARSEGSTEELMKQLNPGVHGLTIGQVLKCRKASMRRVVTGWKFINTSNIARYYNGGGDPKYREKLDFVLRALERRRKQ
ncbi:LysM peptidoglycan-binding domain-containing protein [Variovorax sp. YR216]|uniref:LysM peptidoglycan-binding domain-containing protein n=1 Tax=Variovorax sp. YR216 TaxID=1882828 RepID=UPI00210A0071|nr:LysM peptidoglycan-binding domain-containing protein [Variovorax sp. YR216]